MAVATPPATVSVTMSNSSGHNLTSSSQPLEDLACAYWGSDTLFAALELNLFASVGEKTWPLAELARIAQCLPEPLTRLLTALCRLNLVEQDDGGWRNQPIALRHLIPDGPEYLGDFLLYRRYLQPPWHALAKTVAARPLPPALCHDDDYPTRNRHYVRALDQLARLKAQEIMAELTRLPWHGPVLDIGGGAGALSRALLRDYPHQASHATLFDLPEVLAAGQALYPAPADWQGMTPLAGEFRHHPFADNDRFGLILFANFLHIYNQTEAQHCLAKACSLLATGGHLLIHDYYPDRAEAKGPLYDLNMLVNTPNGRCHQASELVSWLAALGLAPAQVIDLASDSSLIIARRPSC